MPGSHDGHQGCHAGLAGTSAADVTTDVWHCDTSPRRRTAEFPRPIIIGAICRL